MDKLNRGLPVLRLHGVKHWPALKLAALKRLPARLRPGVLGAAAAAGILHGSWLPSAAAVPLPAEPKLRSKLGMELGRGEASWYGPGFHGRRTASGERFDQRALTAAHRTLPFGTLVRVQNMLTGRSVNVRINDRGPFHGRRIIDLSEAAGRVIGMGRSGAGTAPVRITVIQQPRDR